MAGATAADALPLAGWAGALVAAADDPASEMLALVWGPRFDREHALALLARQPRADGASLAALHAFAERFDAMPAPRQRALRERLLRIADNAACRASS